MIYANEFPKDRKEISMANYVVIARFDDNTTKRYMDMRTELNKAGYATPEWPPHITFAAYENADEQEICNWTKEFFENHSKFSVNLGSLGVLPPSAKFPDTGVLCLEPAHSKVFVDLYYEFHQKLEEYCTGIGYWNSVTHGNPIIHSTIAIIPRSDLQKAMQIVFESGVFGMAEITALEVYTYPMRLIERYEIC